MRYHIKPDHQIVVGALMAAVTILFSLAGGLWFKDDLEERGIPIGYALPYGIAFAMCMIAWGFSRKNGSLAHEVAKINKEKRDLLDSRNQPIQEKIAGLRGAKVAVENFFEKRDCEKDWPECGRVLALYLNDALRYGLYESPDCLEARVGLNAGKLRTENFVHVYSMMKRAHGILKDKFTAWPDAVPKFRELLLKDIDAAIEYHVKALGN